MDLDLKVVRTNLAPRTIMRGPGFMDAVLVIEQVLEHVAARLRLDPEATRRRNFLQADAGGELTAVQQPGYAFSGPDPLPTGRCISAGPIRLQHMRKRMLSNRSLLQQSPPCKPIFHLRAWTHE